jgi:hypothetical protein
VFGLVNSRDFVSGESSGNSVFSDSSDFGTVPARWVKRREPGASKGRADMADKNVEELNERVARLEKLLAAREPVDITADEIKAFQKVANLLAFDWGDCGINECYRPPVVRCIVSRCVTRCVVRCINECTCGPCGIDPGVVGGISRFDQFGA